MKSWFAFVGRDKSSWLKKPSFETIIRLSLYLSKPLGFFRYTDLNSTASYVVPNLYQLKLEEFVLFSNPAKNT